MLNTNIRIFKLWGIPVEINLSWVFVLALVTWTFATGYYPELFPGRFSVTEHWVLGFLTAILLFISILLHEFSHSLVAIRNGLPIRKITLFMFGGVAQMDRDVDNPMQELKMAAAGPAMSVLLAIVFFALSRILSRFMLISTMLGSVAEINVIVLVFNLVPGFPLDGGRILRAIIWKKTANLQKATRIASRIGSAFAVFLMILGLISIFGGNLIGGLWFIFIGFFLRQAAQSSYVLVTLKNTLGHLMIGDIMRTGVITVDASISLRELVDDYFLRYHFNSFPVLKDGRLVGMVSLRDVKTVERELWDEITVEEIMDPTAAGIYLHPYDPADVLIELIMKKGYGRLPVLDDFGNIVGIITRRDLLETLNMMTYLEE